MGVASRLPALSNKMGAPPSDEKYSSARDVVPHAGVSKIKRRAHGGGAGRARMALQRGAGAIAGEGIDCAARAVILHRHLDAAGAAVPPASPTTMFSVSAAVLPLGVGGIAR